MNNVDLGLDMDTEQTAKNATKFLRYILPHYVKGAGLRLNSLSSPSLSGMPSAPTSFNSQERKIRKAFDKVEKNELKVATIYQTIKLCYNSQNKPYQTILIKKFIEEEPDWKIAQMVQYSLKQYYLKKKSALCDFAELLESQKVKNDCLDIPVLVAPVESSDEEDVEQEKS